MIDPFSRSLVEDFRLSPIIGTLVNWSSWGLYWHCQGVILAGWWCMAHEAGHGTLSSYSWVNHLIGFTLHTVKTTFLQISCPFTDGLFLVHSRTILLLEIDPPCSPQGDDVHWTRRKLCSSNTHRLRTPQWILSYILRLSWYFRGNADLYSHSHGFHATSWLAILPSHKCHGLTYVSFWYECGVALINIWKNNIDHAITALPTFLSTLQTSWEKWDHCF